MGAPTARLLALALAAPTTHALLSTSASPLRRHRVVMSAAPSASADDPLFQYVVLRRDLQEKAGWPLGSLVAQGCHASIAAIAGHLDDDDVRAYMAPEAVANMHKAVLEVKGEAQLLTLAQRLTEAGVAHTLWTEQPEAIPTALASKPARKSVLAPHFKKCQLSTWRTPAAPLPAAAESSPAAG
jgi:peptidyl-tRNA hydrolase